MHKTVPTPLDHSTAAVSLDILCREMPAMVRKSCEMIACVTPALHAKCQSALGSIVVKIYLGIFFADINECLPNGGLGSCAQICTNTPGSFYCSCQPGYTQSGYGCNGKE